MTAAALAAGRLSFLIRAHGTAVITRVSVAAVIPAEATASTLLAAQSKRGRLLKRGGDIVFALLVLSLGSPLFLLLAVLVKLSSKGSVLYCQRRIGRGYKGFGCLKFRTMHTAMPIDCWPRCWRMIPSCALSLNATTNSRTIHGSPASANFCGAPASMNCRSSSMCCVAK